MVTVFLPETKDLSGIEKNHRLTWDDTGAQGTVHALSRLDNAFIATLDE
jgi:hypothetical protein